MRFKFLNYSIGIFTAFIVGFLVNYIFDRFKEAQEFKELREKFLQSMKIEEAQMSLYQKEVLSQIPDEDSKKYVNFIFSSDINSNDIQRKINALNLLRILQPNWSDECTVNLSMILLHTEDFEGAISIAEEVLKKDPTHLMANENIGIAYMRLGDLKKVQEDETKSMEYFKKARNHFFTVKDLYPNYSLNYFNLYWLFKLMGLQNEAKIFIEKAVELEPRRYSIRKNNSDFPIQIGSYAGLEDHHRLIRGYKNSGINFGNVNDLLAKRAIEEIGQELNSGYLKFGLKETDKISITLVWNEKVDLDLIVQFPNKDKISFLRMYNNIFKAKLLQDKLKGPAQEVAKIHKAISGDYVFIVNNYTGKSSPTFELTISSKNSTKRFRGTILPVNNWYKISVTF